MVRKRSQKRVWGKSERQLGREVSKKLCSSINKCHHGHHDWCCLGKFSLNVYINRRTIGNIYFSSKVLLVRMLTKSLDVSATISFSPRIGSVSDKLRQELLLIPFLSVLCTEAVLCNYETIRMELQTLIRSHADVQ